MLVLPPNKMKKLFIFFVKFFYKKINLFTFLEIFSIISLSQNQHLRL